ncbi:triose-phosphate isomerase [archaeon]|jgi:triosephosphate isomerase (TIM)|nr:triose-phosphate isomerase [archaeon]MBT6183053.1 triose-phosphate isomerase [archaeon]MBT6606367.1 triose-phosphate isomerase [archaeon]MBT7251464.1 triose-phosphate isomerase [archaeon]MBT7660740.1 triose-phosphate isomerase [archaeon]
MIILNFKNYKTGKEVLAFAKKISSKKIIAAAPIINLQDITKKTRLIPCAQHVDDKTSSRDTGYVTPKALGAIGIQLTILNHSEHQIPLKQIKETIRECKKNNIKVILCTKNLGELKKFKKLGPHAIAYENPKFIASKTSITNFPKPIISFVKSLEKTRIIPLCGAGINSKEDVATAYKLGCKGILVSSWIMKSKNPTKFLKEIIKTK